MNGKSQTFATVESRNEDEFFNPKELSEIVVVDPAALFLFPFLFDFLLEFFFLFDLVLLDFELEFGLLNLTVTGS